MPSNEYYDSTGAPANNSPGNPATIRAEFDAIEDGFDKLPVLAGNGDKAIFVNAAGTALEAVAAATARTRIAAEESAKKDASGGFAGLTAYKINMKNTLGTFISFLTNACTAARTWTLPDSTGTIALQGDLPVNGQRNALINGDFGIAQRATSGTTVGYCSLDRWRMAAVGSTFVFSQQEHTLGQTDVPQNPKNYGRVVVTSVAAAGNYCAIAQRVESVLTFQGETVVFSFYAKADAVKSVTVEFVQHFGTTGAPSADVTTIGVDKIALTNGWVRYESTCTISSIAGKTLGSDNNDYLEVRIWLDAGSDFDARTDTLGQQSITFEISNAQLELGATASAFDKKSPEQELSLCQRYFVSNEDALSWSGNCTNLSVYYAYKCFPVKMRAAGTDASTDGGFSSGFAAAVGTIVTYTDGIREARTCNSTLTGGYFFTNVIVDAEL